MSTSSGMFAINDSTSDSEDDHSRKVRQRRISQPMIKFIRIELLKLYPVVTTLIVGAPPVAAVLPLSSADIEKIVNLFAKAYKHCTTKSWGQNFLKRSNGPDALGEIGAATQAIVRYGAGGNLSASRLKVDQDNVHEIKGGTNGISSSLHVTEGNLRQEISLFVAKTDEKTARLQEASIARGVHARLATKSLPLAMSEEEFNALNLEIAALEVQLEPLFERRLRAVSTVSIANGSRATTFYFQQQQQ